MLSAFAVRSILVPGLAFGVAGFALNLFRLELFFNVDYIFGSVLAFVALKAFGLRAGVLAGFISSLGSIVLWRHPWAVVIFTAEIAVAGMLQNRVRSVILADIIYWLACGCALVWLFYHHALGVQSEAALSIVLKQSVNGVLNALLASVLVISISHFLGRKLYQPNLQQLVFVAMMSVLLLPAIIYFATDSRLTFQRELQTLRSRCQDNARQAQVQVGIWVKDKLGILANLASVVEDTAPNDFAAMQPCVERTLRNFPTFQRIGLIDAKGRAVAYAPLTHGGKSSLGVDYSDRPFIPELQRIKRPLVSDLVASRMTEGWALLFVAPVVVRGEYVGFCSGAVADLADVGAQLGKATPIEGLDISLLDGGGAVVSSTNATLSPGGRFPSFDGWDQQTGPDGVVQMTPKAQLGVSIMQRWRDALFLAPLAVEGAPNLRVVATVSLRQLVEQLTRTNFKTHVYLAVGIVFATLLSLSVSNAIARPIAAVARATKDMTLCQEADSVGLSPDDSFVEISELTTNFMAMQHTLDTYMTRLETLVEERTKELSDTAQQLKASNEQLRTASKTDFLTGALNRNGLTERMAVEVARSVRSTTPCGVLIADIDNFKVVNDTQGHATGDRVLAAVTAACKAVIRKEDVLGRWGGEEFLFLMPGAGREQAVEIAQKLRRAVTGCLVPGANGLVHVTVSIGVAVFRPGDDMEIVIRRADDALYSAKRNGRDRVESA